MLGAHRALAQPAGPRLADFLEVANVFPGDLEGLGIGDLGFFFFFFITLKPRVE